MIRCRSLVLVLVLALGTLLAPALPAASQDKVDPVQDDLIKQAVDKGVALLRKSTVSAKPPGAGLPFVPGGQSLIGWTLLECGVPASDPLVQKLAEQVRDGVIDSDSNHGVYNLSTALIFLDKLADPSDAPLIESMTVRLLVAQSDQTGGWGYQAPYLTPAERTRLKKLLQERRQRVARGEPLGDPKRTPEQRLEEMRRYLPRLINQYANITVYADNSNTQFAMMALWVARRHDLPVGGALANVGKRFRNSQTKDGAWTYTPDPLPGGRAPLADPYKHPAMTCAGLLGLALDKGVQNKTKDLEKDAVAQKGLALLAKHLQGGGAAAPFPNPLGAAAADKRDRGGNYCYFLFSLERMAVVYDLKRIGDIDWYAWGANDLIHHQAADGSWSAGFPDWNADTCFALLFLKRANVAQDLTDDFNRRPGVKRRPPSDPLLDLPLLLPKEEKRKPVPKKSSTLEPATNVAPALAAMRMRVFSRFPAPGCCGTIRRSGFPDPTQSFKLIHAGPRQLAQSHADSRDLF